MRFCNRHGRLSLGAGFLGDVTMNYYDSEAYKIFEGFKAELEALSKYAEKVQAAMKIMKSAEEATAVVNPETEKGNGLKKDNYYYNEKGELVIPGGDSETASQILAALRCKKAAAAALQELESTPK